MEQGKKNRDLGLPEILQVPQFAGARLLGADQGGSHESDSVEERTTADGHHIRKEIHQENGVIELDITRDDETKGAPAQGPMDAINEVMKEVPSIGPGFHNIQFHEDTKPDPEHEGKIITHETIRIQDGPTMEAAL